MLQFLYYRIYSYEYINIQSAVLEEVNAVTPFLRVGNWRRREWRELLEQYINLQLKS